MFTNIELLFLERHGISTDEVLDVQGMRPVDWKDYARSVGFDFVLCSPGKNCDHRIKTRANSCCQCNSASIAFLKRHEAPGWVYLAYSEEVDLIKIGCTGDLDDRVRNLNSQGYGEAKDWKIIAHSYVAQRGAAEWDVRRSIGAEPVISGYLNRNSGEENRELIKCETGVAIRHFIAVVVSLDGQGTFIDDDYA